MKRLLAISDTHCGHRAGLTPPKWQHTIKQQDLWEIFCAWVNQLRPIDILVLNGDAIQGKGTRSGGTELITSDRHEQGDMAVEIIDFINARDNYLTYGTPYHTGTDEDFEEVVAHKARAEIRDMLELTVEGVNFNFKHKASSSTVPHGRGTPLARNYIWNILWAEKGIQQKANIIVRSHVHYHSFVGGAGWLALTTPALQGLGDKYGSRQCEGTVDFGLVTFDIEGRDFVWKAYYRELSNHVRKPIIIQ